MINQPTFTPAARRQAAARADSVRAAYRGLRSMGWTEGEAGNLAAHLAGLDVTRAGWGARGGGAAPVPPPPRPTRPARAVTAARMGLSAGQPRYSRPTGLWCPY